LLLFHCLDAYLLTCLLHFHCLDAYLLTTIALLKIFVAYSHTPSLLECAFLLPQPFLFSLHLPLTTTTFAANNLLILAILLRVSGNDFTLLTLTFAAYNPKISLLASSTACLFPQCYLLLFVNIVKCNLPLFL
jgi:hypothetical protein